MNSKNSKTSDTHRLLLNLRGKINLNKVSTPTWNEELNYLMNHILYEIFKIILDIKKKKHGEKSLNPSIRICINKIENRIMFKIKTGCYL